MLAKSKENPLISRTKLTFISRKDFSSCDGFIFPFRGGKQLLLDSKKHLPDLQSCHLYVKFSDEKPGLKAMKLPYLDRQNSWVPIEKCETEISINKGSVSPSTKRTQSPLTLE